MDWHDVSQPSTSGAGKRKAIKGVRNWAIGPPTASFSAFADDITVFVSRRLDIKAVKKAVAEYE